MRVVEFADRRGKASVLNDLVAASDAEILVFTDANTRFESGAVRALLARFADPRVGAVCGRLILEAPGGGTPEADLWNRETRTKEAEGELGVCVGANGAIYAARRSLVRPLPPDTTSMDDFLIPVGAARTGARRGVRRRRRRPRGRGARPSPPRRGGACGSASARARSCGARRGSSGPAAHPLLTLAYASRKAARWLAPLLGAAGGGGVAGDAVLRGGSGRARARGDPGRFRSAGAPRLRPGGQALLFRRAQPRARRGCRRRPLRRPSGRLDPHGEALSVLSRRTGKLRRAAAAVR